MEGIAIDQLAEMCKKAQAAGLGKKKIVMSSDDEGNEYHQAWEGLTDGAELTQYVEGYQLCHCQSQDISDYVVLT